MDRRTFLAVASIGAVAGLAGCSSGSPGDRSEQTDSPSGAASDGDGTASGSSTDEQTGARTEGDLGSVAGVPLPVPERMLSRGAPKDAIPAIVDPVFADDWSDVKITDESYSGHVTIEPRLLADDRVIGIERDGETRAYPLRVLNWHEVVNDTWDGPLLVSYCPLCGSGVTAERTVNGTETVFGVSGLLWNSDLVMYDELTGSLWSQIAGTAIRGPEVGTTLQFVPSTLTTWQAWQDEHPETTVLLPPPESSTVNGPNEFRDYRQNPYVGYDDSEQIGIGQNDFHDESGLHPKTQVIGVTDGDVAKAYPIGVVERAGVINDTVGDLPVVVTVGADGFSLFAYDRRVDGATLTFEHESDTHLRADDSRFAITSGRAVSGPHEGAQLSNANDRSQLFWFAWKDFYPQTEVYEG